MSLMKGLKNTSPSGTASGGFKVASGTTTHKDAVRTKTAPTPKGTGKARCA